MARKREGEPVEWKTMTRRGAKAKETKPAVNLPHARWWDLPDEDKPGAILGVLKHIKDGQTALEVQRAVCVRLYGGATPATPYGVSVDRVQMIHPSITGRLTYNLVAIVVDTLVSKITKNQVRPLFLTQGGDYRTQRRAKKLSQFAEGIFYETKFDTDVAPAGFLDAVTQGDGIVHVFEDPNTGRVAIERVVPGELWVDTIDGLYGAPTQMHRVKIIERSKLMAFATDEDGKIDKKKADIINRAENAGKEFLGSVNQYVSDGIAVVESWKLPTSLKADDGAHTIVLETGVLVDEKWKRMRFPFAHFTWKNRIYGWHGASLVEELIGTQVEMNHLLYMMQKAFRLMAAFKVVIENGTVPDSHINDKIGTILHVPKGSQAPSYLTPPALNPQYFEHFERIKARGFEIARISQLSATGVKPAGLDSGEAQRVYHDIESEGFQAVGHRYEQFHLDVIQLALDVVREITERDGGYPLNVPVSSSALPGVKFLRSIDWKDVDLPEDGYVLRAYPISALPSTPAGRLATVSELARGGYIDQGTATKLMNFPDLTQVMTLLGAAEDWIMSRLDDIIEKGEGGYDPPDPLMNLQLAETLCVQEIAVGSANKMEEEKLMLLREWLMQVKYQQGQAATAAPQAAQPAAIASSAGMGVIPDMGAGSPMTGGALQGPPQGQPQLPM
jgi:hypothetical protein